MKLSEVIDREADMLADQYLRRPEGRVALAAMMVVSALTVKAGIRIIPAAIMTTMAGFTAEKLYVVLDDVHKAALDIRAEHRELASARPGAD